MRLDFSIMYNCINSEMNQLFATTSSIFLVEFSSGTINNIQRTANQTRCEFRENRKKQ